MKRRTGSLLRTFSLGLLLFVLCLWPLAHGARAQTSPLSGTVTLNANLRGGPGTNYPIVGKAPAGTAVNVVETNTDRTWYYLDNGTWIAAFLVQLSIPADTLNVWSVTEGQPASVFTTVVTTVVTTTVESIVGAPPASQSGITTLSLLPPQTDLGVSSSVVVSILLPINAQTATLVSVLEGDVIEVDTNGVRETVRYLGVDTPDAGEPGYATAMDVNRRLLAGRSLLLLGEQTDRDSANRLLRHVYIEDKSVSNFFNGGYAGIYINGQMVADGWALPTVIAPDLSQVPDLLRWAVDAARAGRGFWTVANAPGDAAIFALTQVPAVLYSGPGANTAADSGTPAETPLYVVGRSQDGGWIQVRTPRQDTGWVFVPQVRLSGPVSALPVTGGTNVFGPTPAPLFGQPTPTAVVPEPFPGQVVEPTPFPGQVIQPTPFPGQVIQPTPFPVVVGPTVVVTANLRSGPGTFYALAGTALPGAQINVIGRSDDAAWMQTANNTWIAAGLVAGVAAANLPPVALPPAPTPTITPQPTAVLIVPPGVTAPTPTITPSPSPTPTPLGNPTPTATPIPPTPLVRLIALDRGNEWVILYNDGTGTQDLTGWVLVSEAGDQRCPLSGKLAPRESLRVWSQVGPDGLSCGFAEPIWENSGPDAAILLDAYGDEVSRIQ